VSVFVDALLHALTAIATLHTQLLFYIYATMGVGSFFLFQGRSIVNFPGIAKKIFPGGGEVVKLHFSLSERK